MIGLGLIVAFFLVIAAPVWRDLYDRIVPPPPERIAWRGDFEAARADAMRDGRPMLVDVTADWCPGCKVMKRHTWTAGRVADAVADRFVPVRLDVDVADQAAVAQRYGVMTIPTVLILESNGDVREVGSNMTADEMLAFLTRSPG